MLRIIILAWLVGAAASLAISAQSTEIQRSWNQPVEPFNIIGNIYYVGASDITSYLITTPKGHILIDGGFVETVPLIKANIAKLGFDLKEVKILLNSHAHFDHAAGMAELRRLTGAKLYVSKPDAGLMSRGGKDDPNFGDEYPFEPTVPDITFGDGKTIRLAGTVLKANITAGHTPGCTTWTMQVQDRGRRLNTAFICSTSSPGYKLVNNEKYPNIIKDYERSFERLRKMRVDVFLGSHGMIFGLSDKMRRIKDSGANPFIDPQGYREYLDASEADFRKKIAEQTIEAVGK
jgi:metallo-beta-lactamase class B